VPADTYLEAPTCQVAVAAAEAVSAALGRPTAGAPQDLLDWAARQEALASDLPPLAIGAVDRITTDSELKAVWDEADPGEWRAAMADLRRRLG
jgi:hypothetical protein